MSKKTKTKKAQGAAVNWEAVAKDQLHPLKLAIIELFATGEEFSPVMLQRALDIPSIGTVSYHVRALVSSGFLELSDTIQRRGALEHFYRASPSLLA